MAWVNQVIIINMENQHSTSSDDIDFPDERKYAETIAKASESQPTKAKVAAFKSRVFKLVRLYAEKANNLNPLLETLTSQVFFRQPQRMNELAVLLLNRQPNMNKTYLIKLLEIYKQMLCKMKNSDSIVSQTFIRILKKLLEEEGENTIQYMVENFFTKRNCRLNLAFFQFLCRKIPSAKKLVIQKCSQLKEGKKLRPAQAKQIDKLKSKLIKQKSDPVKKEENL